MGMKMKNFQKIKALKVPSHTSLECINDKMVTSLKIACLYTISPQMTDMLQGTYHQPSCSTFILHTH